MIDWLPQLHLLRPHWLWALLPGMCLALLLWRHQRRSGGWEQVIDPALLPYLLESVGGGSRKRRWPALALLAWLLATLAAAGPSFRQLPQPVEQPTDALVLLLDLSYSMKSTDLAPSRIDRARQKLIDLLQRRSAGQTALVAYAGDAHVVTPLTDDHRTIANLLPALNPDMMPVPGSDTAAAVAKGLGLLASAGIPRGHIILISDGVETAQLEAIGRLLRGSNSRLSVLAVGTREGAPLPLPRGGFLRDRSGNIVIPGLDTGPLQALASRHGGGFSELRVDDRDLDQLLQLNLRPTGDPQPLFGPTDGPLQPLFDVAGDHLQPNALMADTWEDQGYWLVLLLLPLAAGLFRRGWLLVLLPLLLLPPAPAALAAQNTQNTQTAQVTQATQSSWRDWWLRPDQQGMRALQTDDPERAMKLFRDPAWRGTAAWRAGDYGAAAEAFGELDSADAWYNRGNALARAGELDAAAEAYRESLQRAPEREDAQSNLTLVEELLEQQKQNQQKEQEQQQEGSEDQPSDSEDGGDGGSGGEAGADSRSQGSGQGSADSENQQAGEPGDPRERGESSPAAEDGASGDAAEQPATASADNPWAEAQAAQEQADAGADEDASPLPRFTPEEAERRQALEQWLRRVPDDPSGLLREKFRYESQRQQSQRERNNDAPYW